MKSKQQGFRTEKYIRYGIRKYSFGAASVAIAAGLMMFLGNGAVSAAEVQGADATVATTTPVATKESESTITAEKSEAKASEKVVETKKVDKTALTKKVVELEAKIASAKKADATAIATANEVLTAAKAVLANETAKQVDIDAEHAKVEALITVVVESDEAGKQVEETAATTAVKPVATTATEKAEETKETKEAEETVKPVQEANKVLEQVTSEAEVTNVLATEAIRKNKLEAENKAAIEAAIANNKEVIAEAKKVLVTDSVTAKQINDQLSRLNDSIIAVFNDLKKAGIGKDGNFGVALAAQDFYAEEGSNTTHASETNAANHTGKDTYTIPVQEIKLITGTDATGLEIEVYSNQRTGEDTNAGNGMHTEQGGKTGHNNKGRVDYPLTPDAAKKLAEEAPLWRNKLRADGSRISNSATSIYSANGGYEYLATEIYGYGYEQGVDRVYIKGLKDRIAVTEKAKQAGWSLTSVTPTNLVPGVTYDEATDTIQGKVVAGIENGVYDLRFNITATNTDGRTVTFQIQNLRAGWVGWQDSTPPTIQSDSARYDRTVGDDANINLRFHDSSGASAIPGNSAGNYDYTTAEGKVVKVRQNSSKAVTGVSGYNTIGAELDDSKVLIPGTNYTVTNSTAEEQKAAGTNMGNAVIGGKVTEAGIYTVSVFAKDYDKLSNNTTWNQSGQEAHGSITVVVKPKVEVQNVETYSTTVPVKISKGATSAKVTMPDGTVTNLKAVNGKWLVDSGSTNTAVTENQELGAVDSNTVFNIPVTSEATAKVGVDNIKVEASAENVKGTFLRERVELNGTDGQKHTAVLNSTSGHWELPADYAEVKTANGDGTTTWTKRQVYTETKLDGGMKFFIYEYTRQLDKDGNVTSVTTPDRPMTEYVSQNTNQAGDGMSVTITFDKHSNTWTSSDGTEVTAKKLGDDSWEVHTKSGFGGIIRGTIATNSDVATVVNTKPIASSQDYTSTKGTAVDLRNEAKAAVTISDAEDTKYGKTTYITRITVTSPSGVQKVYDTKQDANNYNLASGYTLSEVGVYTVTVEVIDSNGNYTTDATIGGTESGVDHGAGSSTATTTYHITVTDTIEGHNVTSTDVQGATQTGTPTFTSVGDGSPVAPSATSPAKLVDPTTGKLVDQVTIDGQGTYTINNETGVVTFVPLKTFTGTATPVTVSLTATLGQDKDGQPITATATATYTPTVTPVTPTATPAESTGIQGATQTGTVAFKEGHSVAPIKPNSAVLLDKNGTPVAPGASVDALDENGNKVGEYTIDPTSNTVTFSPTDKTYKGKVQPATVQAEDENGTKVKTTYTPHIVGVTPTAEPAKSVDVQGATQESTVTFNGGTTTLDGKQVTVDIDPATFTLLDETGTPATSVPAKDPSGNVIGTYTLKTVGEQAVAVFTPTDKTYSGEVQPVRVQAKDKNGIPVETTYTPLITPVTPTATPATSENIQGATQTGTPTFVQGDAIAPIKQGSVKLLDKEGNEVPAGQTTPAYAEDGTTEIGTFSIDPTTGKVTFSPTDKLYSGKVTPATVQAEDENGTKVTTTYTPQIIPVNPIGVPATSEDVQGAIQTGKPEFQGGTAVVNGKEVTVEMNDTVPAKLIDSKTGNVVDSITIPGEGTYTVAPDGTVTFVPEKTFTGQASGVEVLREDKNGTPVTASYTPVVKAAIPTATDAVTEDIQGATQKGVPTFLGGRVTVNGVEKIVPIDEAKGLELIDPKTGKPTDQPIVIPGEGTYTVNNGMVEFKPEPQFTGKGTGVEVQRVDENGTPVKAKYTPVVKPATPTSSDVITTDVQGATQSGTPTFEGGKVKVNGIEKTVEIDETVKPTFDDGTKEKTIPGEGTYTIDETGKVTFTPEKTFTGQATGVTVKRVDKNGTPITAKYTPVVIPVTPTSKDSESEGPKGQPQSGTPTFEGGKVTINGKEIPVEIDETVKPTFDDGTTEKKVPGEGTYTIDEAGKVTFTPEPEFVGRATGVTVKRVDKNGTPITAKYIPTVRPNTSFVDTKGNILAPSEDGSQPKKDIPGYRFVETKKLPNGDTEHVYEKVKTSHKDKEGNEIPGHPTEDGEQPKKDIPGYRFVETKKLPNGDTEHVYEKVKTSHKDKEGNDIPGYPTEDGEQPKKDIPGYRFVETKKLPNGDTEHVYEKVKTSHKDKEGNEIPGYPTEDGQQPKKDIPGYRFVETKKLPNGDTEHVYEKVKTSHKDKEGNEIPGHPTEDGEQPKKDIPGYRFVETKKLPNGDTEHVYEKVKTSHKDKEGNDIPGYPTEDGQQPKKDIPGYRFVETKKLPNGDTEHVYEKVVTTPQQKPIEQSPATKATKELPNTGTEDHSALAALGVLGLMSGFGLVSRKKKED